MHSEKVAGASALNKRPPFFLYIFPALGIQPRKIFSEELQRKQLIRSGPVRPKRLEYHEHSGSPIKRRDVGGRTGELSAVAANLEAGRGHSRFREL